MAAKNDTLRRLFNKAESKFGFRFACELHETLKSGSPVQIRQMIRQVLA